ncbi:MAG: hypothetical protein J6P61_05025 [Erysipelotrichaceae bacterium]|nr:hypothetical protein [Erysipelotrichaceae bacterium]
MEKNNQQGLSFIDRIMRFKWGILAIVAGLVIGSVIAFVRRKDVLTFNESSPISIYAGTTANVTISSKRGKNYTPADLVYEVGDPSVLDIDGNGLITGKSEGSTDVTCKLAKGRCDPATITVNVSNDVLTLNNNQNITLTVGKSQKLSVSSASGINFTDGQLRFTSTNRSAVEVEQDGTIKAVGEGYSSIGVSKSDGTSNISTIGVTVNLKKVSIKNGTMLKSPSGSRVAPLKVEAGSSQNVYIYFKNKKTPSNSFAFYLKKGKSKTMNVPLGTYTVYYATGQTWYGKKHLFGKATVRSKLNTKLKFYISGNRYMGHSLKLYAVTNGNVSSSSVGEKDFPS